MCVCVGGCVGVCVCVCVCGCGGGGVQIAVCGKFRCLCGGLTLMLCIDTDYLIFCIHILILILLHIYSHNLL